jgi:hypothetical protein
MTEQVQTPERVLSFDKGTIDNWRATWLKSKGQDSEIPDNVEHLLVLLDTTLAPKAAEIYTTDGTRLFSRDLTPTARRALFGLIRSGVELVSHLPAIPGTTLLIEGDTTNLTDEDFDEIGEQAAQATGRTLN